MLMQPKSPSPEYDFILKEDQSAKRGLPLPRLPKPLAFVLAILFVLILIIIIASALSGRKNSQWQPFEGVLARGEETIRVTKAVQDLKLQDPQTQALAATINSTLSSDQTQLVSYLSKNHVKVAGAQLAADTDKSTDTSLQTAAQNNNLDAAYVNYVRDALNRYRTDLQNAYKTAGPNGKKLLSGSYDSTQALMGAAPLKS